MSDAGLQPERTTLAWTRTLLALLVITLLVWRSWTLARSTPLLVTAIVASGAAAVLATLGFVRARQLRESPTAASVRLVGGLAASLVVLAACVVAAVLPW